MEYHNQDDRIASFREKNSISTVTVTTVLCENMNEVATLKETRKRLNLQIKTTETKIIKLLALYNSDGDRMMGADEFEKLSQTPAQITLFPV